MPLDVLVTAHSQGDFAYFPRLYTTLRTLKRDLLGKTLLLDTGKVWSEEVWVCQVTENRAPYILLDAMGYTAAFADGLTGENCAKVESQIQMRLFVSGGDKTLVLDGAQIKVERDLETTSAYWKNGILYLPLPPKYSIYQVRVEPDSQVCLHSLTQPVPPTTLPDPTIAASVEFILDEARYYQKQRLKNTSG